MTSPQLPNYLRSHRKRLALSQDEVVLLVSVKPTAPTLYMFSGHDSDTVNLETVDFSSWTYEWKLKDSTSGSAQGKFENDGETTWHTTGSKAKVTFRPGIDGTGNIAGDTRQQSPGKNTIQLWANGTLIWEKPLEVIQIQPRSSWGADAPTLSIMEGMTGIAELTVHHSANSGTGPSEIKRIQDEHMAKGIYALTHEQWGDIAYHFILDPSNGTDDVMLYEGRQLEGLGFSGGQYTKGSAVKQKNTLAGINVCVLGDYEFTSTFVGDFSYQAGSSFPEAYRKKLEKVLTALSRRYKDQLTDPPTISDHTQLAQLPPVVESTECPGNNVIPTMPQTVTAVQTNLK